MGDEGDEGRALVEYVFTEPLRQVSINLKHLNINKGAPYGLPKPLWDQFPVRVCSCALCIYTVCEQLTTLGVHLRYSRPSVDGYRSGQG